MDENTANGGWTNHNHPDPTHDAVGRIMAGVLKCVTVVVVVAVYAGLALSIAQVVFVVSQWL